MRRFYALYTEGEKSDGDDYDDGKSLLLFLEIKVPSKWGSMVRR